MTFLTAIPGLFILVILHWAPLTDQSQVNDVSDSCFEEDIFAFQPLKPQTSSWLYKKFSSTENEALSSQWSGECTSGFQQSPIDIPRQGNVWQEMDGLSFDNYASSPVVMRLTNTGHGLRLDLGQCDCDSRIPTISGAHLNGTFRFYQAHFHWGSSRNHGSEHLKSGTSFPMEVQLLHYNAKYESMKAALEYPDGLAGLAIFFQVKRRHLPITINQLNTDIEIRVSQMSSDINYKLEDLVDQLPNVSHVGSSVILDEPLPLFYLLPKYHREFFRYSGSLTSPPCTENVQWTILRDPVPITLKQMSGFDAIFRDSENRTKLSDNFRPIQDVNNRTIYQRLVVYNRGSLFQVPLEGLLITILVIIPNIFVVK
ncbi:hypothetical protein TCAL_08940 [Tigriopus californicus]|uniref:Alpha-carbonic anhydrase domain-containing protein n=1 Tax=Tigriopus californicus TaxID=6832 RepID=A0A553PPH3_TIGCA|nr:hypothetical protein TCAL_08940 [Tigriopus californicus]